MMGLWELMASGGLPALAKLEVTLRGRWGGLEEMRTRVAPALEAVAGTLTHFCISSWDGEPLSDQVETGYEFGLAVGKLRRLKDLSVGLFDDGRAYHAMAQGLAASGGECALPLLWRMTVLSDVDANADLVASLILPNVRVFVCSPYHDGRAVLLTACAVRRAGYKHVLLLYVENEKRTDILSILHAIAPCTIGDANIH
jgi:hypothetical protein